MTDARSVQFTDFFQNEMIFSKMKLVIALIIKTQVFCSLVSAANFDFNLDDFQGAAKRFKREYNKPTCLQPPETPEKKYTVKFPHKENFTDPKPGEAVPEFTIIVFRCSEGYAANYQSKVSHMSASVCVSNSWLPPVVKCKKICKDISHLSNFNLSCNEYVGGPKIPCTGLLLEHAIITPRCREYFHPNVKVTYDYVTCREDGSWDQSFFACIPDCGDVANSNSSVSFNAGWYPEKRGGAPWNVALLYAFQYSYTGPVLFCEGTLINAELVITAAHCFYNYHDQTERVSPDFVFAYVAKASRQFGTTNDYETTKKYGVRNIFHPDKPDGAVTFGYNADIVILQLSEKVSFSPDVFPACLHRDDRDRFNPGENAMGKLSGFDDLDKKNVNSVEYLLSTHLPYVSFEKCLKGIGQDFLNSKSVDKFCAQSEKKRLVNRGDDGGGLLFMDQATGLYYLRGVVSNVSSSSYRIFTDVSKYMPWIMKIIHILDNKTECHCNPAGSQKKGSCLSKSDPCSCKEFVKGKYCDTCKDGYWNLKADSFHGCEACGCNFTGSYSSTCDKINGSCRCKPNVKGKKCDECVDFTMVMGSSGCGGLCDNFSQFTNFNMSCYEYYGGPKISCTGQLLERAIAIPRCKQKYHPNIKVNYEYATCRKDGTWDKSFFKCIPDCGKVVGSSVSLISDGTPEKRGGAPWYVAIYSTQLHADPPDFICGGTLINAELVVSAAHCFYDMVFHKNLDRRFFRAIVAKATADYKRSDFETTKTYMLKNIFFPDTTFRGDESHLASDIVILQLSEKVSFSEDVFPACLYWDDRDRFNPKGNVMGKLSGLGAIANGSLSTILLSANLPYINYSECLKLVQEDFRGSISVDKFCAGSEKGPGARPGDSGGGLLFRDNETRLYHLRGVVSNKDLSTSSIATFTDVALYMPWIVKIVETVERKSECGCNLDGSVKGGSCESKSGPCQCKVFVTGNDCDTCKDGFWNLRADNPDGCEACACNNMGSLSSVCDRATGFCQCKPNVIGRQCNQCEDSTKELGSNGCEGGSVKWVKFAHGERCSNAVVGGYVNLTNETLFIARHQIDENLRVGKLVPSQKLAFIPDLYSFYDTKFFSEYEVLCGGPTKWVETNYGNVPERAFAAVSKDNGQAELHVCRIKDKDGSMVPGSIYPHAYSCSVPFENISASILDNNREVLVV